MNSELEWHVVTDPEELFRLKKAGWEIEIGAGTVWMPWDGKGWPTRWEFRALPPKPKMKNQMEKTVTKAMFPQLRANVFDAIDSERCYQERKWGTLEDHPQSVGGYLTLMRVHLARAENAWASANNDTEALACMRKVLAIGVACGEQHGLPKRDILKDVCLIAEVPE